MPSTPATAAAVAARLLLLVPLLGCGTDVVQPTETDYGQQHAARAAATLLGTRAAAVDLPLLDGGVVPLGELLGKKPVYLKFWATWCAPCLQQMGHLEAVYREHDDQLAVFAVNLGLNESVEAVRQVQAERSLTVPVVTDREGALARQFHVSVTPQHVLIDRAGVIRFVGHHADAALDRALEAQLTASPGAAEPPTVLPAAASKDGPLTLTLRGGASFKLADHAGKPIALTFLSTWADWYLAESRPAMAKAAVAHAQQVEKLKQSRPDVVWVSVASPVWTVACDVDEYLARLAVTGPISIDEDWAWFRRHRVSDVPTTVFLGKDGNEVARQTVASGLTDALAALR